MGWGESYHVSQFYGSPVVLCIFTIVQHTIINNQVEILFKLFQTSVDVSLNFTLHSGKVHRFLYNMMIVWRLK